MCIFYDVLMEVIILDIQIILKEDSSNIKMVVVAFTLSVDAH